MDRRKKIILACSVATVVCLLVLVLPAMAQAPAPAAPAEAGGTVSYFSRFFHTDNPLGTSLIWFCLIVSIGIVSLIINNLMTVRSKVYSPPQLIESVEQMLADKQYKEAMELTDEDKSPFGQIMAASLHEAARGYAAMEMALEEKADELNNRRVRNLIWLEVAGAAGPMIGLFGTVFGMILSFQQMLNQGGQPKAAELAGGIATALVCTFWGLIVGIPGVIAASLFRVKVEGLTAEAIITGKRLISQFRPGPSKKSSPGGGTATGPATPKPVPA